MANGNYKMTFLAAKPAGRLNGKKPMGRASTLAKGRKERKEEEARRRRDERLEAYYKASQPKAPYVEEYIGKKGDMNGRTDVPEELKKGKESAPGIRGRVEDKYKSKVTWGPAKKNPKASRRR